MGLDDTIGTKSEDLGGKAKEATGNITGDDSLKNEDKGAQAKGAQAKGGLTDIAEQAQDLFAD
jgi:uncharacterized protein YjbJ (UPF0337 family)